MRSVVEACTVRPDILHKNFNPEIFTLNLSEVVNAYRGKVVSAHALYTDAESFFRDATYPTEGLRMVLGDVFGRLAGDASRPAIQRLETAFGGGKTHILIAMAHLAFRGRDLEPVVRDILPETPLPAPGEISLVGIAGDEVPVRKPQGKDLVPYALWGEIAYQIGGEALYRDVRHDTDSYAAPGKNFLERVFAGRKVLLLIDELAQYATRLEAAVPNGSEQLAAFLMSLNGYARSQRGIAVVISLAGEADAFATQTRQLTTLLSQVKGEEVSEDEAIALAQRATPGARSVLARDAVTVVPVQASEISRVLAKRLLVSIDEAAARTTAEAYMAMYAKNSALLPDEAFRADFRDKLLAHYPFHPTLIRFLTQKLATVENFQGTRGVLRVLAAALHALWAKKSKAPMIHTHHLDLQDARTVNEILGRTGANDLLDVLNTDVGGPDTGTLAAGASLAQLADRRNPHPDGHPLHEYTWRTVFLHSLVGRAEGLGSNLFGITEKDALLEIAFPGMTPPQVQTALEEIERSAYYLRFSQGRYYASLDPSENRALAMIRNSLGAHQVDELLAATARKVVQTRSDLHVVYDVALPEHIPDKKRQPVSALVALEAHEIDPEACITQRGPNQARDEQNLVLLLVPEIVRTRTEAWSDERRRRADETRNRLEDLARSVAAMRRLKAHPEHYGISPAKLTDGGFDARLRERELALVNAVTQAYNRLWFSGHNGQVVHREIKTGAGEGGAAVMEQIWEALRAEGKLITAETASTQETLHSLAKLFFDGNQTPSVEALRADFACNRRWPMLEDPKLFDQILRSGVQRGHWCLFRMGSPTAVKPEEFFSRESGDLPFQLDFAAPGWCLVPHAGAVQRGWTASAAADPVKLERWIVERFQTQALDTVDALEKALEEELGGVPQELVSDTVQRLVRSGKLVLCKGHPEKGEKIQVLHGPAAYPTIRADDTLTTPAEAVKRGWMVQPSKGLVLEGRQGAETLRKLLPRLGSFYAKGAVSRIEALDLTDLEVPGGGRLRVSVEEATPEGIKRLQELFEVIAALAGFGDRTDGYLKIPDPDDNCPLIQAIRQARSGS